MIPDPTRLLAVAAALALAASAQAADPRPPAPPAARADAAAARKVARGEYIVTAGLCHDCHTPKKMGPRGPEMDNTRMLSGHREDAKLPPPPRPEGPWIVMGHAELTAWAGPWGISYAANLTPDEATGIGSWSEETFVKAIRTGRHMGASRPILPPMPVELIAKYTDEDLKAIFAYLKSIPPVKNRVPDPVIAETPQH